MRRLLPWGVSPSILMYHSIIDNSKDPYSVSVSSFRDQITWLFESGFDVVSLSFLLRAILNHDYRALSKKVVITFDDGYKDFIANALPVLIDHGAPATVFLVTEMFGGRSSWNEVEKDEKLMSEDEVRYIKSQGISLGSHTSTHVNLTLLDNKNIQRQLRDSHDKLTYLGESFITFSYPWGQWSSPIVDAVKASGYECALAVGEKTKLNAVNRYCLPRITMRRDINLKHFQSLLMRTNTEMKIRRGYRTLRSIIEKKS